MIEGNRTGQPIRRLCKLYGVSPSGYYAWRDRPESQRAQEDGRLGEAITELHQGFRRSYGSRRVHQALRQKGYVCSVRRVNRLMQTLEIKASTIGLYAWQPGRQAFYENTGNNLATSGPAQGPGTHWGGDFTYINTQRGYLFFAVVMDFYTRKVIGWAGARSRNAVLTKSALVMALKHHHQKPGCLFHSDQGIEYAAYEFREVVTGAGMIQSMSRKGTPVDNAIVESFFHSMKNEAVQRKVYRNEIEAMSEIITYVNFYNQERLHSSLDYQSPLNYEKLCA
jgi:transposase InsO family protein